MMIYFCVKFQKDPLYGLNLTFFAPWLPLQRSPFWFFSTPQKLPHTMWIFLQSFMKGIQNFFEFPFFVSMATATKFVQPIPIFLAYLVPLVWSISVWRVTCYDNFCVFQFFLAFWPFPWQRRKFENSEGSLHIYS